MTAAPAPSSPPTPSLLGTERCNSCGARLASDQEWCLECGAARTRIQPPPDWRIGVAIVAAVLVVIVIVVVLAWP